MLDTSSWTISLWHCKELPRLEIVHLFNWKCEYAHQTFKFKLELSRFIIRFYKMNKTTIITNVIKLTTSFKKLQKLSISRVRLITRWKMIRKNNRLMLEVRKQVKWSVEMLFIFLWLDVFFIFVWFFFISLHAEKKKLYENFH